jgi:hypothetical protein
MVRWIVVAALALRATARGEPPPSPEAQARIDAGVSAFNAKDYTTASTEFEAAYALAPLPKVLFAWAQARRLGGHCEEAIPLYRRYLATKPTDEQIEAATTGMLLCERASPPPPEPTPVVTVPPPPSPPVAVREHRAPWYRDTAGGVLVASGVISLAAGATFLVLASHSEDAANAEPLRSDFLAGLDEATLRRRIGWAGIGVGSGLLLGGIARYLFHDGSTTIDVAASHHSIAIAGRF